jgi:hypothetical protein
MSYPQNPALKVDAIKSQVSELEREVSQLYRDKARLLEELVTAGGELAAAKRQSQEAEGKFVQVDGGGTLAFLTLNDLNFNFKFKICSNSTPHDIFLS